MKIEVESDAWADSPIESKLWLCEVLENHVPDFGYDPVVWILAGWYGMTAFLLRVRGFRASVIRSFDVDPTCERIADLINNHWLIQDWAFKSFTQDCTGICYEDGCYGPLPDIIINTSAEHFPDTGWFQNIPDGKFVAIQSNNMPEGDGHISLIHCREDMIRNFPMRDVYYYGERKFIYPDKTFTRFMVVGRK